MDLRCQAFRDLIDIDRVSKVTVVVDCLYDNLTQVINHLIPTEYNGCKWLYTGCKWLYTGCKWLYISRVSCQKGPTRHAYAWRIGPFWQDTLNIVNDDLYAISRRKQLNGQSFRLCSVYCDDKCVILLSWCQSVLTDVSWPNHYTDVIMSLMASQITSLAIVYSPVCSGIYQRKHQSSVSLAFVTGEFPTQKASNAENVSIWWRHHVISTLLLMWVAKGVCEIQRSWIRNYAPTHEAIHP